MAVFSLWVISLNTASHLPVYLCLLKVRPNAFLVRRQRENHLISLSKDFKIMEMGLGTVGKVFAAQEQGSEFGPQNLCWKK